MIKNKNRVMTGLLGAFLAVGIVATTPGVALADAGTALPKASQDTPVPTPDSAGAQLSDAQSAELESLVGASDFATSTFDADAALTSGVDETAVADYALVLEADGWTVIGASTPNLRAEASPMATEVAAAAAACTGKRGYTGFHGVFWQFALNSCDTDLLIASVAAAGSSTAAIGGVIAAVGALPSSGLSVPAGAITAAVGGLIAAGAGPLTVCKTASHGVHAIYLNAFVTGGIGCWGQ